MTGHAVITTFVTSTMTSPTTSTATSSVVRQPQLKEPSLDLLNLEIRCPVKEAIVKER